MNALNSYAEGITMRHGLLLFALTLFLALRTLAAVDPPFKSGIDPSTFDTSVKPGDNFYQYVNGNWIKKNPIPPEYSRWGAFPQLRDDTLNALHAILEDLSKQSAPLDEDSRKLRDFYLSAMDEAKLEQQGASPLAPEL